MHDRVRWAAAFRRFYRALHRRLVGAPLLTSEAQQRQLRAKLTLIATTKAHETTEVSTRLPDSDDEDLNSTESEGS